MKAVQRRNSPFRTIPWKNDLFRHLSQASVFCHVRRTKPGGSYYIFHADSEGENFRASLRKAGFKIAQCCIWVKNTMVMGRPDYQWQHEPCLYGWKPVPDINGIPTVSRLLSGISTKPQRNAIHPTMKPIALMAYPISTPALPVR